MRRPRVLSVIGTRPEAIKMAPVIRALEARGLAEHRVALTGQHADMVDPFLSSFDVRPHYDLQLMTPGQTLHDVGRRCLQDLPGVFADFRPDATVVQGDTATAFFAAVATFFEGGKVAHVEAGLRSRDKWAPFPEEMLRRMTDCVADYCFAPTSRAAEHLRREGVPPERVFVTGNTVVDALQATSAAPPPVEDPVVARVLGVVGERAGLGEPAGPGLAAGPGEPAGPGPSRLVLLTAHRRESFGAPLEGVFGAVRELASRFDDVQVLYPVHPNPRVREPAQRELGNVPRVHLVAPLSYGDLLAVLRRASLVLTDSGGIQEEAPTFGVHALVLREVTERPEGVEAGCATLVGTDPERIVAEAVKRLEGEGQGDDMPNPYGDGRAGERIADVLLADLTNAPRETEEWTGV